jgi:hypothetical protein
MKMSVVKMTRTVGRAGEGLQENQMKLDAAKAQAEAGEEKPGYKSNKMHSLNNSHVTELNGAQLAEDVVVLGAAKRR